MSLLDTKWFYLNSAVLTYLRFDKGIWEKTKIIELKTVLTSTSEVFFVKLYAVDFNFTKKELF